MKHLEEYLSRIKMVVNESEILHTEELSLELVKLFQMNVPVRKCDHFKYLYNKM